MTFLHPWALSLATLASVPLVLHLLRRDTKRRIAFPALRYLEEARRRHARSVRLRDRWLLAVRMLLVAAVAIAAAGPLVGSGGAADHEPTDVGLVIDNSASMSARREGTSRLGRALALASVTLAEAAPGDRFWIRPTVGPPLAENAGPTEARAALGRLAPSDAAGRVPEAVRSVLRALPTGSRRAREVQVLTDYQATSFDDPPVRDFPDIEIVLGAAPPDGEPNGAVVSLAVEGGRPTGPGGEGRLVVGTRLYGARDSVPAPTLRLEIDGTTVALATGRWNAETVFALPPLGPGPHVGRVSLPPSGLSSDDGRAFVLDIGPPPRVGFRGAPGGFLRRAIEALAAAGLVRLGEDEGGAEVLRVVEGADADFGATASPGLPDLVLVPPADPASLPRFVQGLAEAGIPWRLRQEAGTGDLRLAERTAFEGADLVRISRRLALERVDGRPPDEDEVVLRTEDGKPWLVRGPTREGARFLLLASPLVPGASDLVVRPAMIPFVEALLLRWPPSASGTHGSVAAGSRWRLPADADSLRLPDGRVIRTDGGAPFTPTRAGIHEIYAGHGPPGRTERLAVHAPATESATRRLDPTGVEARFPGRPLRWASAGTDGWKAAIFGARRGRHATLPFLIVALALAAIEMGLAAPGRRPRGGPGERAAL